MKNRRTQTSLRKMLANVRGETMVETLVAILISSLALLMMANAIGTAVNMVKSSRATMEAMYADESSMIASATATPQPSTTSLESIEFAVPLELDESGDPQDIDVTPYSETEGKSAFYERAVSE